MTPQDMFVMAVFQGETGLGPYVAFLDCAHAVGVREPLMLFVHLGKLAECQRVPRP